MLRPSSPDLKVYLHRAAIDMRKAVTDWLPSLVK